MDVNSFLVRTVDAAIDYLPHAQYDLPLWGAKHLLLADDLEDEEFLAAVLNAMYTELPAWDVTTPSGAQRLSEAEVFVKGFAGGTGKGFMNLLTLNSTK